MKRDSKTARLTIGAMMIALSIILPQIFHFTGIPQVGAVFLPMHIPVLLAGFILGPVYGTVIGVVAPVISYFITAMPTAERLPFMIGELAVYGLVSGLMYHQANMKNIKMGTLISLVVAMLAGRVFYAGMLFVASKYMGISCGGAMAAVTATVTGIYGIVLQIVVIPPIVYACKKGGFINDKNRKS
jgi:uncharacterized membrane protein